MMSMLIFLSITSTLLTVTKCSRVIDTLDSFGDNVKVQDYCPKIAGCDYAGSHVLCVTNPNNLGWFGPRCNSPKNISVTESIAVRLLSVFNAMRKKVALGKETGKNGDPLPKAYGVHKLDWDPESALFAQIWANQCVFSEDLCHVTQRFVDPGQLVGKSRFYYPSWQRLGTKLKAGIENTLPSRITHAILGIARKWYTQKKDVDEKTILSPNLPPPSSVAAYLQMINGKMTHVGCGVSNYVEYVYNHDTNLDDYLFHVIMLVCNFSHKTKNMKAIYDTEPPNTEKGESAKCGCPSGTTEDEETCLCSQNSTRPGCTDKQKCKPKLIYLPIVNVEDAPQDYLPGDRFKKQDGTRKRLQKQSNDSMAMKFYFDISSEDDKVKTIGRPRTKATSIGEKIEKNKRSNRPQNTSKRKLNTSELKNHSTKVSSKQRTATAFTERKSIFTRVKPFELPTKASSFVYSSNPSTRIRLTSPNRVSTKRIKDVTPRKSFDEAKEYLDDYLNNRRRNLKSTDFGPYSYRQTDADPYHTKIFSNVTSKNYDRFLKNKFSNSDYNVTGPDTGFSSITNHNEVSDGKVLKLLDNLEQEVQHIQDYGNGIVQDKIKKIYDTITSNARNMYSPRDDMRQTEDFTGYPYKHLHFDSNRRLLKRPDINNNRVNNIPHDFIQRDTIQTKRLREPKLNLNNLDLGSNRRILENQERIQRVHDLPYDYSQREVMKKHMREPEYYAHYPDVENSRKALEIPVKNENNKGSPYDHTSREISAVHRKDFREPEHFSNDLEIESTARTFKILETNPKVSNNPFDHKITEINAIRKKFEENAKEQGDDDEYKIITRPLLPQITSKDVRYDIKRTRYADLIPRQNMPEVANRIEYSNPEIDRRKYLQEKLQSVKNKLFNIRKFTHSYNFEETRPTRPVYKEHEEFNVQRIEQQNTDESNKRRNEQLPSDDLRRNEHLISEDIRRTEQPQSEDLRRNEQLISEDLRRTKQPRPDGLIRNDAPQSEYLRRTEQPKFKDMKRNDRPKPEQLNTRNEYLRSSELNLRRSKRPRSKELNLVIRRNGRPRSKEWKFRRNERPRSAELNVRIQERPKYKEFDMRRIEPPVDSNPMYVAGRARTLYGF